MASGMQHGTRKPSYFTLGLLCSRLLEGKGHMREWSREHALPLLAAAVDGYMCQVTSNKLYLSGWQIHRPPRRWRLVSRARSVQRGLQATTRCRAALNGSYRLQYERVHEHECVA